MDWINLLMSLVGGGDKKSATDKVMQGAGNGAPTSKSPQGGMDWMGLASNLLQQGQQQSQQKHQQMQQQQLMEIVPGFASLFQ